MSSSGSRFITPKFRYSRSRHWLWRRSCVVERHCSHPLSRGDVCLRDQLYRVRYAAGVVTGILIKAAHKSGTPDAWRASIDAVWTHPVMGGSPLLVPPPILAVLGGVALSVGTVAAGVSLKRAGSSWAPVVLLALAGFGISVFRTHAWPGGPLTFCGLAVAGGWLLGERAKNSPANGSQVFRRERDR